MNNKDKGKEGEELAKKYLEKQKYKIIFTNFKTKNGEIDLIAINKKYLVFIEVKMRENEKFGNILYSIDKNKQEKIIKVAREFLFLHKEFQKYDIRFDALLIKKNINDIKFELIKNAFSADIMN